MIRNSMLTTNRLVIRLFRENDVFALVEMFSDPLVARYVDEGHGLSLPQAKHWVQRSLENHTRFGYGTGAVALREQPDLAIGWAGIARPDDDAEEIIYGLSRAFWGQGYGKEIVNALVCYGRLAGKSVLRATVDSRNLASVRLLEKNGFELSEDQYREDPCNCLFQIFLVNQEN